MAVPIVVYTAHVYTVISDGFQLSGKGEIFQSICHEQTIFLNFLYSPTATDKGQPLATEKCAACHGIYVVADISNGKIHTLIKRRFP